MVFRQILARYVPIDCKNKLNKLLAEVERNFGVFSRDMELDIRTSISSSVVLEYFDRIIHEEHPRLEHDVKILKDKSEKTIAETNKKENTTLDVNTIFTPSKAGKKKKKKTVKKQLGESKIMHSGTAAKNKSPHSISTYRMVDSIVNYFKNNNSELNVVTERCVRQNILGNELLEYYKDRMQKEVSIYRAVVYRMLNVNSVVNIERRKLRIDNFEKKLKQIISSGQVVKQQKSSSSDKKETSFDILKKKEWILDWNCVMFKRGHIVIYARQDLGFKFNPKELPVSKSIESFNYLKKYLNERLSPVRCEIVGSKLRIIDRINFDEAIQQFAIAARQGAIKTTGRGSTGGVAPLPMPFSQAMSKAKQMTPDEFKKYKSEYIDFLVTQQSKEYKVIPCVERLVHSIGDTTEYAFMFSIECKSGDILIVHENVNPDRSTLLFIVKRTNYEKCIRAIYDFLQSAEMNKRSSLRDRDLDIGQVGIERYRSINHDNLYSWKRIITIAVR